MVKVSLLNPRRLPWFSSFRFFQLILYHTIPTFNDPGKEARKHCGKRRKCWLPAFSPFPTMFSALPSTNFSFSVTFILSFASSFNLDQSKKLSFGKGLTFLHVKGPFYIWIQTVV